MNICILFYLNCLFMKLEKPATYRAGQKDTENSKEIPDDRLAD